MSAAKGEMSSAPATEEERQLANKARDEFEAGKYDACCATISKLNNTRNGDPKLTHNKAVVEYCKSKLTRTDEFKKALQMCCSKVNLSLDHVDNLEDADQSIMYYNQAVIFYHTRQYKKALHILNKLFSFIEPIDALSRHIMFFLTELYIQTLQPKEALGMVSYVEKMLLPKPGSEVKEQSAAAVAASAAAEEQLRATISQYKVRCFIVWKSLKNCKREMKTLAASNNIQSAPLIYLKANNDYLRGNYRKAIKVLNSAPPPLQVKNSGYNLFMMHYNNLALLHFAMRKHHMGALYLRKALEEDSKCTSELCKKDLSKSMNGFPLQYLGVSRHYELLYNMGVQQLHCGNAEAAFDCLLETTQRYKSNPRLWLRIAECCIMANRASNDDDRKFSKKREVVREAIGTGVHRKVVLGTGVNSASKRKYGSNEEPFNPTALPTTSLEFASLCVKNALLLLPEDSTAQAAAAAAASASNASPNSEGSEGDARSSDYILVAAPPSSPLKGPEVDSLRCSVLAAGAYISLCLNDWVPAHAYAKKLLQESRASNAQKYLAQMYLAEAQVALDLIADAVVNLDPNSVTDISLLQPTDTPPKTQESQDRNGDRDTEQDGNKGAGNGSPCVLYPWSPSTVPVAQAIMQYNLAVSHAIRGQFTKAVDHLNDCCTAIEQPYYAQVDFLRLYLELIDGRRKNALNIIKENFGNVCPNIASP